MNRGFGPCRTVVAPSDSSITEKQWEPYYNESTAVEKTNINGTAEFKKISNEELMQNTDRLLEDAREKLVKVVMGNGLDNAEKTKIAKPFRGSLYFLSLWCNEQDGGSGFEDGGRTKFSPRTVTSTTRLYSPFGLGTSVDFKYYYHNRRFRANEEFSALVMCSRSIRCCLGSAALECAAEMGGRGPIGPPTDGSVRIFNWSNGKTMGTTAPNMSEFYNTLFACWNWLSSRLMFNLLCAGGIATIYQEATTYHVWQVQHKFKLFAGEIEDATIED